MARHITADKRRDGTQDTDKDSKIRAPATGVLEFCRDLVRKACCLRMRCHDRQGDANVEPEGDEKHSHEPREMSEQASRAVIDNYGDQAGCDHEEGDVIAVWNVAWREEEQQALNVRSNQKC